MPTITDADGTHEISADELARLRAEDEAAFAAFWDALAWRPIAAYDRAVGEVVLLRRDNAWALGFWGDAADWLRGGREEETDAGPAWRDAQESMDEAVLRFDPTEFAAVDDVWRLRLMAD